VLIDTAMAPGLGPRSGCYPLTIFFWGGFFFFFLGGVLFGRVLGFCFWLVFWGGVGFFFFLALAAAGFDPKAIDVVLTRHTTATISSGSTPDGGRSPFPDAEIKVPASTGVLDERRQHEPGAKGFTTDPRSIQQQDFL